jgi:hypothetical protein
MKILGERYAGKEDKELGRKTVYRIGNDQEDGSSCRMKVKK